MTKEERKDISIKISKCWELDSEKVEKIELEFMANIKQLLWYLSMDKTDEIGDMNSSYEAGDVLETIIRIIKSYNEIYHKIHTMVYWKEEE